MKQLIIGSLVGALILFFWGFLSWTLLPVHFKSYHYTPAQDSVMSLINSSNLESGAYLMPMADNRTGDYYGTYMPAMKKNHEAMKGKPFVSVFYSKEGIDSNPLRMLSGLLINLISVLCASIILFAANARSGGFFGRWWIVMLIAAIISLEGQMIGVNWLGVPWHFAIGLIFDHMVGWALCGAWLSWYYGRE